MAMASSSVSETINLTIEQKLLETSLSVKIHYSGTFLSRIF